MPLGTEELETLKGFGRDADMSWNTVQHKTHYNTYNNRAFCKIRNRASP